MILKLSTAGNDMGTVNRNNRSNLKGQEQRLRCRCLAVIKHIPKISAVPNGLRTVY